VTLVDGENEYEGRVEIYKKGRWGTLCKPVTHVEASYICRHLGYLGGVATGPGSFGEGVGVFWDMNFTCLLSRQCSIAKAVVDPTPCDHKQDYGVVCGEFQYAFKIFFPDLFKVTLFYLILGPRNCYAVLVHLFRLHITKFSIITRIWSYFDRYDLILRMISFLTERINLQILWSLYVVWQYNIEVICCLTWGVKRCHMLRITNPLARTRSFPGFKKKTVCSLGAIRHSKSNISITQLL
jgi:hypothetical protein